MYSLFTFNHRVIVDIYRPMLDYHECPWGSITTVLLTIIIVAHFLFSAFCIAAVRNGMESFSDGTIIKESLIAFYFCLVIGIMLENIGLEHKLSDFIRSLFFNIGATLFCTRLMASRVFKYWLPERFQKYLNQGYAFYKTIWPTTATNSANNKSGQSYDDMTGDCPVYQQRTVQLGDINELVTAMEDPSRLKILRNLALKNHLVENVDFICGVLRFKEEAEQLIMNSSGAASDEMKTQAMAMWYQYLQINSPDEVNVSSTAREMLKTQLDQWAPNVKVVSKMAARGSLETDSEHRLIIFESAYREILTMLYQNLWTKFRVEEAQALTLEDGDNDSMMSLFSKEKAKKIHVSSGKPSNKVASEKSSVTLLGAISEVPGSERTTPGNASISSLPANSERSSEVYQMNKEEIEVYMKEKEVPTSKTPSEVSGSG
jgi:DNA-binding transcriptional ArsR family regulator